MWKRLLALCVVTFLLCGCETAANYKTLSFFFDGVPNPDEQPKEWAGIKRDKAGNFPVAQGSSHGPYAAKECGGCHMRGTNTLVEPIERLCLRCHVINLNKKWVHGPLASGGCRFCHLPHNSSNPYLLASGLADPCFACHEEKAIKQKEYHKGTDMKCTRCHDAHMSDRQYLLK
jgi:predicted CXXCH cytochrome family protein